MKKKTIREQLVAQHNCAKVLNDTYRTRFTEGLLEGSRMALKIVADANGDEKYLNAQMKQLAARLDALEPK